MVRTFWLWSILLVLQSVRESWCRYEPVTLPAELQSYFDAYQRRLDLTQIEGELVFWTCVQQYIWRLAAYTQQTNDLTSPQVHQVFVSLLGDTIGDVLPEISQGGRTKRQARQGVRVRVEVRQMTRRQRRRYFRAVNRLKRDRRVQPNVYDWLAAFHSEDNIPRAHFGPHFPAWHRVYLYIYETLLRQHIPDVTIPYWCSHLDGGMGDMTDSIIWANEFFGNPSGTVNEGPFASWERINRDTVPNRAVGQGGRQLYTLEGIARIMSRTRHSEILMPTFLPGSNFEGQHGLAHVAVGGTMNNLNEAPRDPIFYSHHAYVDKLWEDFREKIQREDGVDPETDYPYDSSDPRFNDFHAPNSSMGFGFGFTNIFGYSSVFSRIIRYSPEPACPGGRNSECDSIFYRCFRRRCISRSQTEMPTVNYVNDTTRDMPASGNRSCPPTDTLQNIYHNYEINGKKDASKWVYLPVKVISKRRSEFKRFQEYSTYKPTTRGSPITAISTAPANLAKYEKCDNENHTAGKIKVVSYGMNYVGHYFDFALIDKRMPLSIATTFVGVKAPGSEGTHTEAILAAFDECGRACRPFTKSEGGNFPGTIRVTSDQPRMYGSNFEEAMSDFWDQASETSCPRLDKNDIYITFYCDYTNIWPWASNLVGGPSQPVVNQGRGPGQGKTQSRINLVSSSQLPDVVSSLQNESLSIGRGQTQPVQTQGSIRSSQPRWARQGLNNLRLVGTGSSRLGRGGSSNALDRFLSSLDSQTPIFTGPRGSQTNSRSIQRMRTSSGSDLPVSTGTFQRRSGISPNFVRPRFLATPLLTGTRLRGRSRVPGSFRPLRLVRAPVSVQNWLAPR